MDREDLFQNFIKLITSNDDNTEDDKTFRKSTKEQITDRDKQYTQLLMHFVKVTKVRNILKEIFKWTFYLAIISAMVVFVIIVYNLFNKYIVDASIEQMIKSMPLLLAALVSFISAVITIPTVITKYLFSTKEDDNITKIILHTQKHDVTGRQWTTDFKKVLDADLELEKSEQQNIKIK